MTDMKYTDEQIVRALECCANNEKDNTCQYCRECPASNWELDDEECDCMHSMYTRSISIINRQKAEIDEVRFECFYYEQQSGKLAAMNKELEIELEAMRVAANSYKMHYETARAEAIKEFAERLRASCDAPHWCVWLSEIDEIEKELTEGRQ